MQQTEVQPKMPQSADDKNNNKDEKGEIMSKEKKI